MSVNARTKPDRFAAWTLTSHSGKLCVVMLGMIGFRSDFQVVDHIVSLHFVDMVNILMPPQKPPEFVLHEDAM